LLNAASSDPLLLLLLLSSLAFFFSCIFHNQALVNTSITQPRILKTQTTMKTTTATTFTTFLALLEFVSATYFTSPQVSTVWQAAPGQVITWHYQAGGAAVGDIVLQANGLSGSG